MAEETPTVDRPSMATLFEVVKSVEASGKSYAEILEDAKADVEKAEHRLQLLQSIANVCKPTKTRKPRKDRGMPRKKTQEQAE